jgi:hypothetical protein
MNLGFIQNPEQYAEAIKTGTIEPMFESITSRSQLIRKENEKMRNGENPPVLRTDMHEQHINEHLSLLDDPDVRYNAQIVDVVLAHVQMHEQYAMPPQPMPGEMPGDAAGGPMPDASQILEPGMAAGQNDPNMPSAPGMPNGAPPELAEAYGDMVVDPGIPQPNLGV